MRWGDLGRGVYSHSLFGRNNTSHSCFIKSQRSQFSEKGRLQSRTMALFLFIALLAAVDGQVMPQLKHDGLNLSNNSFIYSRDIGLSFNRSLMCVSGGDNFVDGGWKDPMGNSEDNRVSGDCLFSKKHTDRRRVTTLHRERSCTDHKLPGLWRCDALDSSRKMQTLYIFIGGRRYPPDGKCIYTVQSPKRTLTVGSVYIMLLLSFIPYTIKYRTTEQVSAYELHSTH